MASKVQPGQFIISKPIKTLYAGLIFFGLVFFVLAISLDAQRAWYAYLVSFFYFTSLGLGGLFYSAIQHVAKVGWSVNVRRFPESLTAFIPVAAVGAVILLAGAPQLYAWLKPEIVNTDALIKSKTAYLNFNFFAIRLAVFFGIWLLFKKLIVGGSLKQDQVGGEELTIKNVAYSVVFCLLFALSYSLFSVDTLMSVQPHWFSTIWGVYCFAGLSQSTFAVMILLTMYSMKNGWLNGLVSDHHMHDLAKFLKGFTVFYAYIAFSQFMLIWYANLPEETGFYLSRSTHQWMYVTVSLFVLKFALPFLLLLPRWAKRSHSHLKMICTLILIMQYVDIHWMIYPNLSDSVHFSWQEVAPMAMFAGLFLWTTTWFLSKNALVPIKDPRIEESIHHHVTY